MAVPGPPEGSGRKTRWRRTPQPEIRFGGGRSWRPDFIGRRSRGVRIPLRGPLAAGSGLVHSAAQSGGRDHDRGGGSRSNGHSSAEAAPSAAYKEGGAEAIDHPECAGDPAPLPRTGQGSALQASVLPSRRVAEDPRRRGCRRGCQGAAIRVVTRITAAYTATWVATTGRLPRLPASRPLAPCGTLRGAHERWVKLPMPPFPCGTIIPSHGSRRAGFREPAYAPGGGDATLPPVTAGIAC
jgi:hypothetical protein